MIGKEVMRTGTEGSMNGSDDEQAVMVHSSQIDQVRRRAWGVRHMRDTPNGIWIENIEVEGLLGEAVTGDARDTATEDPMGDDSRIRDGGDGIACGHGSSMFGAEHQRMGFGAVVIVFSSSFSFGEADGLEEALDAEIALCLDPHFLARSLCAIFAMATKLEGLSCMCIQDCNKQPQKFPRVGLLHMLQTTRGLDGGVFGGEITDRARTLVVVFE
ncbi:hypothetical protein EDB19DRAFT_2028657 [Suillus lakei]|nr:hypothetical protein EDB19DRAFT_2028657 [Suillus lakei]